MTNLSWCDCGRATRPGDWLCAGCRITVNRWKAAVIKEWYEEGSKNHEMCAFCPGYDCLGCKYGRPA